MKIIFMGTPEFSVPALLEIIKAGHEVVAVYTQPARPKGRGQGVQHSPVAMAAMEHNIPLFTPASLKTPETQAEFRSHKADLAVVVAYGLLLPKPILDACTCINIHASILPRWRGAAPIQRAIQAGDKESGITIMLMDEGLDTGDMLLMQKISIPPEMNAGELHDALSKTGGELVIKAIEEIENKTTKAIKQTGQATYAEKIKKAEAELDFKLSGKEIINNIRAFNPYPGAFLEYNGEKIKILAAEFVENIPGQFANKSPGTIIDNNFSILCKDGIIKPKTVQRQGRKVMSVNEFLNGFSFSAEAR